MWSSALRRERAGSKPVFVASRQREEERPSTVIVECQGEEKEVRRAEERARDRVAGGISTLSQWKNAGNVGETTADTATRAMFLLTWIARN